MARSALSRSWLPVTTITFVAGATLRISLSVAMPSLTPSGSGGSPRSCNTTAGSKRRSCASASLRESLNSTSCSSKHHFSCFCRPRSSSTIRSFGFSSFVPVCLMFPSWCSNRLNGTGHHRLGPGGLAQGHANREARPLPGTALHFHVPRQALNVFAYLIRAYAHAFGAFGAVERPKQAIADEFGIHSLARVAHDQLSVTIT